MDILSSVILGVVQGLTEFLPISSSGHLILAREILGLNTDIGLAVDAVLQLATALAIFLYFRKQFFSLTVGFFKLVSGKTVDGETKTAILAILLGTIPAVIAGLFLESYMETTFRSALLVALTLILGTFIFIAAELVAARLSKSPLTVGKGILIGIFQCLALVPGMSRSGMTIAGGLFLGLTREEAARFGFLLAFPIILGSGLKKLLELGSEGVLGTIEVPLFFGALAAFLTGMAVIHYLLKYLKHHGLWIFAWYRLALGVGVLLFLFF